jgi:hypothetical protein
MVVVLVDRLAILVAVRHVLLMFAFDGFWGMCGKDSCNVFLLLCGTLGSYLRDALHEGSADAVACRHVPRA